MSKLKLLEEIRAARTKAIERADEKLLVRVKGSIGRHPSRFLWQFLALFLILIGITGLVFLTAYLPPSKQTERILERQPIITEKTIINQTTVVNQTVFYPKPEFTADCVSVREIVNGKPSDKFSMLCERVK